MPAPLPKPAVAQIPIHANFATIKSAPALLCVSPKSLLCVSPTPQWRISPIYLLCTFTLKLQRRRRSFTSFICISATPLLCISPHSRRNGCLSSQIFLLHIMHRSTTCSIIFPMLVICIGILAQHLRFENLYRFAYLEEVVVHFH